MLFDRQSWGQIIFLKRSWFQSIRHFDSLDVKFLIGQKDKLFPWFDILVHAFKIFSVIRDLIEALQM